MDLCNRLWSICLGKPSKITVNTYGGKEGVINIEREVEQSGGIMTKES